MGLPLDEAQLTALAAGAPIHPFGGGSGRPLRRHAEADGAGAGGAGDVGAEDEGDDWHADAKGEGAHGELAPGQLPGFQVVVQRGERLFGCVNHRGRAPL